MRNGWLISFAILVTTLPAGAADKCAVANPTLPACSYTSTNGNCLLTINRNNPVAPPTIFVRSGKSVTVCVNDPSPVEDLTLDWKSSATVVPPDTFQNLFQSLSGNFGKFTGVVQIQKAQPAGAQKTLNETIDLSRCESDNAGCDNASDISAGQQRVMASLDIPGQASEGLRDFKEALQPPPGALEAADQAWREKVAKELDVKVPTAAELDREVALLASEVLAYRNNNPTDQTNANKLDSNQSALASAVSAFEKSGDAVTIVLAKLAALKAALLSIDQNAIGLAGNAVIEGTNYGDKNYQTQTWILNSTNKLSVVVKRVAGDKLKSEGEVLLAGLGDAPPKQPLVSITVQFQSPSILEFSTGLIVPTVAYHSYSKASVAQNGVVTDNVVQETKTFTVVPAAFVNVRIYEWVRQRSAIFFTSAVGFNPVTNTVEFGEGLTYSYRSIAISALADIGRDTKLGGGFTVGQSLGLSKAANPITSTYWAVKPSLAISVRIPLGGSGSGK